MLLALSGTARSRTRIAPMNLHFHDVRARVSYLAMRLLPYHASAPGLPAPIGSSCVWRAREQRERIMMCPRLKATVVAVHGYFIASLATRLLCCPTHSQPRANARTGDLPCVHLYLFD